MRVNRSYKYCNNIIQKGRDTPILDMILQGLNWSQVSRQSA